MKVHAMRHGESEYNILGLCNDDPTRQIALTGKGQQQAQKAADQMISTPLDKVFCSQLLRAKETANIVAAAKGMIPIPHPGLNDIRSGCDGKPVADYLQRIRHDKLNAKVGNGESLLEYRERVLDFLAWLERQSDQNVLLVAHEETMRILYGHAKGLTVEELPELGFGNCEVFSFGL